MTTLYLATRTKLYNTWVNMKQRCTNPANPNWNRYGGRGITYCKEWESYSNFYADMASTHRASLSLDRIDNDGPYDKENCRWVTAKENSNNSSQTKSKGLQSLTPEKLACILQRAKRGERQALIAADHGISQQLVSKLHRGEVQL